MFSIVPIPKIDVSVRVATLADVPFMDSLQKRHGKALGHFPTRQFEGYIEMNAVLVAECGPSTSSGQAERVGYIIHRDRYLKRDELGVMFQLCVTDGEQRKLVGATLVRAAFERSAYGCRLYCLWCAQDLDANYFWESLGFVPIAFRAGSDKKKRVHIFWQKRIVEGDVETKWWYPFQTAGGALRADRVVFPIPEGTHWRDVRAVVVPTEPRALASGSGRDGRSLPDGRGSRDRSRQSKPALRPMGGFRFQSEIQPEPVRAAKGKRPKAAGGAAAKIDPKFLTAARELRDRWMEHVNAGGMLLESAGKYDVVRQRHLSATGAAPTHLAPKCLPPLAA